MTFPRLAARNRLLVLDREAGDFSDHAVHDLPDVLSPGDLLVVNDAATLPASVWATFQGQDVELRLAEAPDAVGHAWAVTFGAGSWRQPTELRLAPPPLDTGDVLRVGGVPVAVVRTSTQHPRLVRVQLPEAALWRHGRPVQYSYLDRDLQLHEVQVPYAGRPWAVEMPSAGRPLGQALRASLAERGVTLAAVTHGAGLSSTGDPALDAALPLPERYEVSQDTWDAVASAERVIAAGTSAVRALESAARGPLAGRTELVLGPQTPLRVVDGLLSGMHEPDEPHFRMMGAFASPDLLRAAHRHAVSAGYRNHEFGDSTLIL